MPIPRWKIAAGVAVVVVLIAAVVTVLWWAGTRGLTGKDLVTARLDALRVGLGIGVGGGGVFALYLAWRRQRSTEADLDNRERALAHQLRVAADTIAHQERVAAATEADAEARRITDLYTKAADQLGSDKAPVRLAGLYALERLAQDHVEQRQTIVNVLCAYLRMPYTLPGDPPTDDTDVIDDQAHTAYRERVQEREVRLTAQRVLTTRLHPGADPTHPADTFWEDIDLDLTGATLVSWNLNRCRVRNAMFVRVRFSGAAGFEGARFGGPARFIEARFDDPARFIEARFDGPTGFDRARFDGTTAFDRAQFDGATWFAGARFGDTAWFDGARFDGPTAFDQAQFDGATRFDGARFRGPARFDEVQFERGVPAEIAALVEPPARDDEFGSAEPAGQ